MKAPGFWYKGGLLSHLLAPLSPLWAKAGQRRQAAVTPYRAAVPVVCVGNLVAGGAGKTPVALSVAEFLSGAAFLSRGYGGELAGPVQVDPKSHDYKMVGDEPLLLAESAPCWVAKNRRAGARAAIAGGADVALIPEIPYSLEGVINRIEEVKREGRNHALVVVAEGCHTEDGRPLTVAWDASERRYGGIGHYLSQKLSERVEAETRVTVLGHVQRGGEPSNRDRILASAFGVHAVDLVADGQFDRVVVWQNRGVTDVAISKVVIGPRAVDPGDDMVRIARGLGIYVGEPA